ncbi:DUF4145 domain-containing protein [Oceanibaculum nanhaiense]|uniref:DUF4145 domain-containing protein n=1 Tax=Oceanibaculum nanhaiense TaxID=1909734 RepID=UPI003F70EC0C
MFRIDNSALRGTTVSGKTIKISAINSICPHCNSMVTFNLSSFMGVGPLNSIAHKGRCPSCGDSIGVWALNPSEQSSVDFLEVYLSPSPKNFFPTPTMMDSIPDSLKRSLIDTIKSYNSGIYTATAVTGRRTLEGIFKNLLPESKRNLNLSSLIDAAISEKDLSSPLSALSHAIRGGGNIGAHFDSDHEPNEAVARQMVELLCYLISYLYVLPDQIEKLENDLKNAPVGDK